MFLWSNIFSSIFIKVCFLPRCCVRCYLSTCRQGCIHLTALFSTHTQKEIMRINSRRAIPIIWLLLFVSFVKCLLFMKVPFLFYLFYGTLHFLVKVKSSIKLFQSLLTSRNYKSQTQNIQRILKNETINVVLVACKDEASQTLVNIHEMLNFNSIQWIYHWCKGWRGLEASWAS